MKMRLTIDVDYKDGTITEQEARTCLTAVAFDSATKGLFTGPALERLRIGSTTRNAPLMKTRVEEVIHGKSRICSQV